MLSQATPASLRNLPLPVTTTISLFLWSRVGAFILTQLKYVQRSEGHVLAHLQVLSCPQLQRLALSGTTIGLPCRGAQTRPQASTRPILWPQAPGGSRDRRNDISVLASHSRGPRPAPWGSSRIPPSAVGPTKISRSPNRHLRRRFRELK